MDQRIRKGLPIICEQFPCCIHQAGGFAQAVNTRPTFILCAFGIRHTPGEYDTPSHPDSQERFQTLSGGLHPAKYTITPHPP
jgi:hypothetical protein